MVGELLCCYCVSVMIMLLSLVVPCNYDMYQYGVTSVPYELSVTEPQATVNSASTEHTVEYSVVDSDMQAKLDQ